MENKQASSSFFRNEQCAYFPCHEGVPAENFNCLLCYCPLYALGPDCDGGYYYNEQGVKCCDACCIPHQGERGVKHVQAHFAQLKDLASKPHGTAL